VLAKQVSAATIPLYREKHIPRREFLRSVKVYGSCTVVDCIRLEAASLNNIVPVAANHWQSRFAVSSAASSAGAPRQLFQLPKFSVLDKIVNFSI